MKKHFFFWLIFLSVKLACASEMQAGFYASTPYYHFQESKKEIHLTGLDVEVLKAVAEAAGFSLRYKPGEWVRFEENMVQGNHHIAAGVPYVDRLKSILHYSEPYRFESFSLFSLRDAKKKFSFHDVVSFIKGVESQHYKLGVIEGEHYYDADLMAFLMQKNSSVRYFRDLDGCYRALFAGDIDGFVAEKLSGATLAWQKGQTGQIVTFDLVKNVPIHFAFSKASTSPQDIKAFDRALKQLKESGEFDLLFSKYLHPLLLLQTLSSPWFFVLEIIGTIAFAISGLILASRDRITLFGALVYAFLPSMGGGILRDLLVGRETLGAVLSPIYAVVVILTVLLGFLVVRITPYLKREKHKKWTPFFTHVLVFTDALGLAAFTVIGVVVASLMHMLPLWLWGPILAFLTGAGGGILRDMVRKTGTITCFHKEIYAEIALFWGFLLSLYFTINAHTVSESDIIWAVILTIFGSFSTRLLVYYLKIPNLSFSPPRHDHDAGHHHTLS